MRPELGKRGAQFDAHGLLDPDIAAIGGETGDAGLIDGFDERPRAAIHHRNFRPVDLDHDVVDVEGAQRRHEVLDRRHRDTVRTHRRAQVSCFHMAEVGRDFPIASVSEIGTEEVDAAIGLGRMQGYADLLAAVNPDARQRRAIAQRRLRPQMPSRHTAARPWSTIPTALRRLSGGIRLSGFAGDPLTGFAASTVLPARFDSEVATAKRDHKLTNSNAM